MVASATETNAAAKKAAVAGQAVPQSGAISKNMPARALPNGHYTLVSVDIDTTGRRLIDEIVQLAAYSPNEHFEQYIMPYMNLNPAARQRHQVRVISIGFYRMLKSMHTCKIIKSKSEIAALKDFLDWLESLKSNDKNSLGVILIYHEERKFIPYMILEAVTKYNLLDRFANTVQAFANSSQLAYNLFSSKESNVRQPYTLRRLARYINGKFTEKPQQQQPVETGSDATKPMPPQTVTRICVGNDTFDGNASVRARLAYEVAYYLCNLEQRDNLESKAGYRHLLNALLEEVQPLESDLCELKTQNENVERQNSFRPVFFVYFRATLFHRMRAVKFRIVLAEHCYDLNTFNVIWQKHGRDGILSALQAVPVLKPEERHELVDLFDSYFDPKKTVVGPIVKNNRRRNRRISTTPRGGKNEGNSSRSAEPGAGGDKENTNVNAGAPLPDSPNKSPKRSNGPNYNKTGRSKRFNPRVRNGSKQVRFNQQPKRQNSNTGNAAPNNINANSATNMAAGAAIMQPHLVAAN